MSTPVDTKEEKEAQEKQISRLLTHLMLNVASGCFPLQVQVRVGADLYGGDFGKGTRFMRPRRMPLVSGLSLARYLWGSYNGLDVSFNRSNASFNRLSGSVQGVEASPPRYRAREVLGTRVARVVSKVHGGLQRPHCRSRIPLHADDWGLERCSRPEASAALRPRGDGRLRRALR